MSRARGGALAKRLEQQSLLGHPLTNPRGHPDTARWCVSLGSEVPRDTSSTVFDPSGNALTTEEGLPDIPFCVHIGSECHVSKHLNILPSSALVHTHCPPVSCPSFWLCVCLGTFGGREWSGTKCYSRKINEKLFSFRFPKENFTTKQQV